MAEASGGRTHRRRDYPPPAGFEDRDDHRTACASGRAVPSYFGCGTILRYGLGDFQPPGYCFCASSLETAPLMITSSPCFQFAGVATLCLAVSCMESRARRISSKLRPVVIG